MQDIESHTIIYLRALLATRAIDDPEVAVAKRPDGFRGQWVPGHLVPRDRRQVEPAAAGHVRVEVEGRRLSHQGRHWRG
jgi:hypothetical protein